MLIDCHMDTDDSVIIDLKKIRGVAYAYKLIGYHDIIVKVQVDSEDELRKVISEVRTAGNIIGTTTMIALEKQH